jgi:peptidoglycan/LPS O-acetylase OafA/YrhL
VPVHLIVLALTALLDVPYARSAFWWNAPFLANLGMVWRDEWFGRFSPLWSLAALEQFYFWWPLAILWVPRRRLFLLIGATIATALAWTLLCWSGSLGSFYWTVIPFATFDQVGFGALLALVRADSAYEGLRRFVRGWVGVPCGAVLIALVAARIAGAQSVPFEVFWISLVGCLFFVWLIDRSLRGFDGVVGALLRNPVAAAAGRLSYSVFLLHNFTELLVPRVGILGRLLDSDWRSVVLIPLTFALSQIVWMCVELPIARFRQTHFARHHPVADPLVRAA